MSDTKIKITLDPSCFSHCTGTQEDIEKLAEKLVAELHDMLASSGFIDELESSLSSPNCDVESYETQNTDFITDFPPNRVLH